MYLLASQPLQEKWRLKIDKRCLAHVRASGFIEVASLSTMPDKRSSCFCSSSFGLSPHFSMNLICCSEQPDAVFFMLQSEVPPASSTYICIYSVLGPSSS